MNLRELLHTRFTEMYQLMQQGDAIAAAQILDQLVQEIEDL